MTARRKQYRRAYISRQQLWHNKFVKAARVIETTTSQNDKEVAQVMYDTARFMLSTQFGYSYSYLHNLTLSATQQPEVRS